MVLRFRQVFVRWVSMAQLAFPCSAQHWAEKILWIAEVILLYFRCSLAVIKLRFNGGVRVRIWKTEVSRAQLTGVCFRVPWIKMMLPEASPNLVLCGRASFDISNANKYLFCDWIEVKISFHPYFWLDADRSWCNHQGGLVLQKIQSFEFTEIRCSRLSPAYVLLVDSFRFQLWCKTSGSWICTFLIRDVSVHSPVKNSLTCPV